ncbi:hypothetical protein [Kineococcus sp. R86509]|uniref:hypothetical protein n=1 Tax=Kineococcus sp. R86509 TaxID=3093851 RepID=UPI0036D2A840
MSVWLAKLSESTSTAPDTRKWARNTVTTNGQISTVAATITGGDTFDFSNTTPVLAATSGTGTSTTQNETWFGIVPPTISLEWTGDFELTANTAGSDAATSQSYAYLWLNHDGTVVGSGLPGVSGVGMRVGPGGITLVKVVAGAVSAVMANTAVDTAVGNRWSFRFRRAATNYQLRWWAYGTTEPTTWQWDATDDTTVPAGVPALTQWRYRPNKAGAKWRNLKLSGLAGTVRRTDAPKIFRRYDGRRVSSGRSAQTLRLGPLDSTLPSFLSAATAPTLDPSTRRWTLTAAANSTVTVAFPAIPAGAFELLRLELENAAFSGAGALAYRLGFSATTAKELFEDGSAATAFVGNGASTRAIKAKVLKDDNDAQTRRNLRVELLPRIGQFIASEGESGPFGGAWLDFSAYTETVTPTLTLTATGGAARSVSFSGLVLTAEAL